MILVHINYQLSYGQAKFLRILSQNCQNDLEGQGQWPPFSIPAERMPGCMFAANFVILAQICDELLCRQVKFPGILSQKGQNDIISTSKNDCSNTPSSTLLTCSLQLIKHFLLINYFRSMALWSIACCTAFWGWTKKTFFFLTTQKDQ